MSSKVKDKKAIQPKLRFPEFKKEWNTEKVSYLGLDVTAGATPDTSNSKYWGGNIRWMNSGELNLKKVYEVENRITELGLKESSTKMLPKFCVLIGLAGQGKTRGTVAMNMIELCTNQSIAAIHPSKKINYDFLYHQLDGRYEELRRISAGDGGRGGLNLQHLKDLSVVFPPSPKEQQKIANCLSSLDELIEAEGQKLDALKDHKKGLMQELFPAEGQTLPKRRFPEFKDAPEWESKPLGEVIKTITPPEKIQTSNYLEFGKWPIIDQSQDFIAGWTDNEEAVISEDKPLIVFGDHTCVLKIIREPFAQGADGIKIFYGLPNLDTRYLFQYLQHNPLKMEEYKRHFSILKEKSICYPEKKTGEQQRIADFLTPLDELITAQIQKLDALRDHKKGLMQQLFPAVSEVQE